MNGWKTMQEWRDSGPPNYTDMLVLFPDGTRAIAAFDGCGQCWCIDGDPAGRSPVAWAEMPEVPAALRERQKLIKAERERLENLERASLEVL